MAEPGEVAALGLVGGLRQFLGFLQFAVGLFVGFDFRHQHAGLAVGFFLGDHAAFVGQHEQPGHHAADNDQDREHLGQGGGHQVAHLRIGDRHLGVDQRQQAGHHQRDQGQQPDEMPQARAQLNQDGAGQNAAEPVHQLFLKAGVVLAGVVAARVQGAAQRTDRAVVGRAERHVLIVEAMLADAAGAAAGGGGRLRGAGDVVAAVGEQRDQRRRHERGEQRQEGGQRLGVAAPEPAARHQPHQGRHHHGAEAHRVDVVEIGPFEFDALGAQPQRLVDHQVGDQGADPRHRHHGVAAEDGFERPVDADLHQHQGDHHVEYQPHHPARVAVGEPGKEVGPGDGAGVGVGHVDLQLRQHHENTRQRHERGRVRGDMAERHQIHVHGFLGLAVRQPVGERQHRQEGTGQRLEPADDNPARAAGQHRQPPAPALFALRPRLRHEAQEIHLLADLRHQGKHHRGGGAEQHQIEGAVAAHGAVEALPAAQ